MSSVLALVALTLSAASTPAVAVVKDDAPQTFAIDFEDYPATGPGTPAGPGITDFYADLGVTFNSPSVLDYDQGIAIEGFARSGSQVAEHCYSQEFCSVPIRIDFDDPQARVGMWVGYSWTGLERTDEVMMIGYDAEGSRVAVASVALPGGDIVPVDTFVEVWSPEVPIRSVEVRWDDAQTPTNGLAIDDVTFEPWAPSVSPDPDGSIDLGKAEIGSVVEGVFDVVNTGNTAVAIDEVTGSEGLVVVESLCTGVSLLPGERCAVTVVMASESAGVIGGFAAVSTSAGGLSVELISSFVEPEAAPTTSVPEPVTTVAPPTTEAQPVTTGQPVTTEASEIPLVTISRQEPDDEETGGALVPVVLVVGGAYALRRRARARKATLPIPRVRVNATRPSASLAPADREVEVFARLVSAAQSYDWPEE